MPQDATIVFDLDGTLIHTSPDIAAALNASLAGFGKALSQAEAERLVGGGLKTLLCKAFDYVGLEPDAADRDAALKRLRAYYRASPARLSTVHDWVVEAMIALHREGSRIAICSNKDADLVLQILDAFDLSRWIHGVTGSFEGSKKKPDPEPLLEAISQAGGVPSKAVMIGDSAADVGAARAAGIAVILVPHGYGTRKIIELGADRIVANSDDLRVAVGELTGRVP